MKKLFKFLPILLTSVVSIPMVTSLSSCAPSLSNNFKYIDYAAVEDGSKPLYGDMKSPNASLDKILYGDKHFNGGNYALVFGSTATNGSASDSTIISLLFNATSGSYMINDRSLNGSQLQTAFVESHNPEFTSLNQESGLAFLTFLDTKKVDSTTSEEEKDVIDPFEKWVDTDPEVKKEEEKAGTYKRKDTGAKIYRDFVSKINVLFSTYSDNLPKYDEVTCDASIIFWKDSYPAGALKISGTQDLSDKITTKMSEIYSDDSSKDK